MGQPTRAKNNRDRRCRETAGLVFISDHSPSSLGPAKGPRVKRGRAPAGLIPVVTALGSLTPSPPPRAREAGSFLDGLFYSVCLLLSQSHAGGRSSRVISCSVTRDGESGVLRPSLGASEAVSSKALWLAISLATWHFLASAEPELP